MPLEGIDVSGPELPELREPGVHLLKRLGPQLVESARPVHGGLHKTGQPQDTEMLRHGRLRHAKAALDLSHGLLGRDQQAEDGAAVRLGDDFEDGGHALTYTSYCIYL